jgi:hypothetical protein
MVKHFLGRLLLKEAVGLHRWRQRQDKQSVVIFFFVYINHSCRHGIRFYTPISKRCGRVEIWGEVGIILFLVGTIFQIS